MHSLRNYYFKNIYFRKYIKKLHENRDHAVQCQQSVFNKLITHAANTSFGEEHGFKEIKVYKDFQLNVSVRTYEEMLPYIKRISGREQDVLWPGLPAYFGKSSGTAGASKYIPITEEYLECTQLAARYMIANLAEQPGDKAFIGSKVFCQADPEIFKDKNGFKCASVSAIKSSRAPAWTRRFILPGKTINSISDPDLKLKMTIEALPGNNIRSAVALPVWLTHLLTEMKKATGKKFLEHFPDFQILFLSGMNYEPYENLIRDHMGSDITILENYTATEGNFAYQTTAGVKGMELICNLGIFYEFISAEDAGNKNPERITLKDVKIGERYIMIISNCSGLWAYRLNDIISFVSVDPYRICVDGRLEDIFSPFGEHLLPVQAESAIASACRETNSSMVDFTILPRFDHEGGHRYLCYAEFDKEPGDKEYFSAMLHAALCRENANYEEFAAAHILRPPEMIFLKRNFYRMFNHRDTVQQKNKHLVNDVDLENTFNGFNSRI